MEISFNRDFAINHGIHTAILCKKIYLNYGEFFSLSTEKISETVGIYTEKQTYNHVQKMIKQGVLLVMDSTCRPKKYQINPDCLHYLTDSRKYKKESTTYHLGTCCPEIDQVAKQHLSKKESLTYHLGSYCPNPEQCADNALDTIESLTYHLGSYCPFFIQSIFIKRLDTIYQKILNNILYIYIKKRKKNKQKKEKKDFTFGSTKTMQYQPASGAHYMLSKHVLAELNQLVVPACRKRPFAFSNENLGPIIKQLKNGFSVDDCLRVVKNKFLEWHTTTRMHNSLAPKTLFGSKFENYVGENDFTQGEKHGKSTNVVTNSKSTASSRCAETFSKLGAYLSESDAW